MAAVQEWHLFAYFDGDAEGERDEHRHIAEWQLDDVVRWARCRGYDTIVLSRLPTGREFLRRGPSL